MKNTIRDAELWLAGDDSMDGHDPVDLVESLVAEAKRLVMELGRVEWVYDDRVQAEACPVCHRDRERDRGEHKVECTLALALKRARGE